MNRLLILLSIAIILLTSCQKEISTENGGSNNPGGTTSLLLIKSVSKTGNDSTVTLYSYDGSQRLTDITTTGISNGTEINLHNKLVRNSSGIITQTELIDYTQADTVIRNIYYDPNIKRYTASAQTIFLSGQTFTDSTTYLYDGNGHIVEEDTYLAQQGLSLIVAKGIVTYNAQGTNIVSGKIFVDTALTATLSEIADLNYTYDTKNRPLSLNKNNEAIPAGLEELYSLNNPLTFQLTSLTDPSNSYSVTSSYTYNSSNYPVTAIVIQSPGNFSTTTTYYYQ
jgi:hypothetical protein